MGKAPALCHPERTVKARGLCGSCYLRQWKAENPDKVAAMKANKKRADCHPDRPALGRGLCSTCYRRWWRADPERARQEREYSREWRRTRYTSDATYRRQRLLYKYGMTPADFDARADRQGQRCAACRQPASPLQVDHCHETGRIRGLLCGWCNSALGYAKDDTERLRALIDYLSVPVT